MVRTAGYQKTRTSNVERSTPNPQAGARDVFREETIAIPGEITSAFLAMQLFLGKFDYVVVSFDQIFDAVEGVGRTRV